MNESDFTQEEQQLIEQAFATLLDDYAHTAHRQKVEIITRAFNFANQAHWGVRRLSGEPYIMHPLAVARIVVREIGLGSTSICAALLHDVVEDTECTVETIEAKFGEKIAVIVDGLTKISGGVFSNQSEKQAVNTRKLVLTMSKDARVVLVKIADRLHNMRTLSAQPLEKQRKIATETQLIYAPLAHRLGLFPIKSELEDLSFKYMHPDIYADIERKLAAVRDVKMEDYKHFVAPIREKLDKMGLKYSISARIKSVYSIWEKMQNKNIPFEDVYDLLAVRIVFTPEENGKSESEQCWNVYSAVSGIYRPHPERIRDWVSNPKANGYEALHITVMSPIGQWVEIQIRTDRMHALAERGLAAHWKYKAGELEESELDKWLNDIKDTLANPDPDAMSFFDTFKENLFQQEIFVFTPKGDIKLLPQGASVLDFAYILHSELGEHCIGAKVNHKAVSRTARLYSGDQVEILTSEKQHPEPEWLNVVVSAKAKNEIKRYFNGKVGTDKGVSLKPYPVTLLVRGKDIFGVLLRILDIVSNKMNLFVRSLHAENQQNLFECRVGLNIYNNNTITLLCDALRDIKELTDVEIIDETKQDSSKCVENKQNEK